MSAARTIEKSAGQVATVSKVPTPPASSVLQFERSDLSMFRSLGTLAQKAGVPQEQIVRLAYKELADNALDAGASVTFEHDANGIVWVKDTGPGIAGTDEEIADLFSIGRRLRSSKLLRLPTRGALGNGIRVVVGLVLCTGGRLIVRTHGRQLELAPLDGGTTTIRSSKPWTGTGTQVGVSFGDEGDEETLDWAQTAAKLAGHETYDGASSPHWYDSDAFYELCVSTPAGVSPRALIERLDGCSGAKAGKIAARFLGRQARDLTRTETDVLLVAARKYAREVTAQRLGSIGERDCFAGYGKELGSIEVTGRRNGKCKAALPVAVEVWARSTWQGWKTGGWTLLVNRTPAAAPVSVMVDPKTLQLVGAGYKGEALPSGGHGFYIEVNVQTPHMPITSDGKAPDLGRFKPMLDKAIRKAVGRAKRAAGSSATSTRVTFKSAVLASLDAAVGMASGNGAYRFNLRNLYYAARPMVADEAGKLTYETFTNIITDHEAANGSIDGLFRNERGVLIQPHTRKRIHLGTLTVEKYERPGWSFNKVLYIEKEGFFETLLADGWPERHDCALMSSQGFASRAVRDLVDALGETDEPIEFFCVHDADAFGTLIYQSLQEATRARSERSVQIVNLGLERAEAEAMQLEAEDLGKAVREKPCADYVSDDDRDWYQEHRYELNAMSAPQLIAWLDAKMLAHAAGKVVPPVEVLEDALRDRLRARLRAELTDRILRDARLDALVEAEFYLAEGKLPDGHAIEGSVRALLGETPALAWSAAVDTLVNDLPTSSGAP